MLNKRLIAVTLLGLVLAACSSAPANSHTVLVGFSEPRAQYRFDGDEAGWDVFTSPDEQGLFWIKDGVLEGAVVANRGYLWSLNDKRYSDTSLEAVIPRIHFDSAQPYRLFNGRNGRK